jgi:hypothetical protein
LERWDIEEEETKNDNDFAKSMHDGDDLRMQSEDTLSIGNQSIQTLKFNRGLLCKASAAVDLISQKIEFKNLMN